MGITGYILTVYFTETVNATLSIARLLTVTKVRPNIKDWIIKPLISVILSSAAIRYIASRLTGAITGSLELAVYIVLTASVYLALLIMMKGIKLKGNPSHP